MRRWLAAVALGAVSGLAVWAVLWLLIVRLAGDDSDFTRGFIYAWAWVAALGWIAQHGRDRWWFE